MGTSAFRIGMVDSFRIQNCSFKIRSLRAAFGGEAVFLQAAVGFVGNGAFDEGCGEGRCEIAVTKVGLAFELESGLGLNPSQSSKRKNA